MQEMTRFQTVIIGGGQAGLSVGYHLARRGRSFVILDANERIGDSWRKRWDSLRHFTPARYDGLPGWPFPAPAWSFPTKNEMADYLEAYAARFHLPVRTGVRVDGLSREGERFVLASGDRRIEADQVVLASGTFQNPRFPIFASQIDPGIVQRIPQVTNRTKVVGQVRRQRSSDGTGWAPGTNICLLECLRQELVGPCSRLGMLKTLGEELRPLLEPLLAFGRAEDQPPSTMDRGDCSGGVDHHPADRVGVERGHRFGSPRLGPRLREARAPRHHHLGQGEQRYLLLVAAPHSARRRPDPGESTLVDSPPPQLLAHRLGAAPAGHQRDVDGRVGEAGLDRVLVVVPHGGHHGPGVIAWRGRRKVKGREHDVSPRMVLAAAAGMDGACPKTDDRAQLDQRVGGRTVPEDQEQWPGQQRLDEDVQRPCAGTGRGHRELAGAAGLLSLVGGTDSHQAGRPLRQRPQRLPPDHWLGAAAADPAAQPSIRCDDGLVPWPG
jgi:Pyridine nucleotide-disulphide oxidoreductase